jgi:hypothetical protein
MSAHAPGGRATHQEEGTIMATLTFLTNRVLVAGGFAVAVAVAPVAIGLSNQAVPSHAVAECPATEIADPSTGACVPIADVAVPTQNPINPEGAQLQPGGLTQSTPGDVGELPAVNGIPCTGGNVGQCIGLQESQGSAGNVELPPVPIGATH